MLGAIGPAETRPNEGSGKLVGILAGQGAFGQPVRPRRDRPPARAVESGELRIADTWRRRFCRRPWRCVTRAMPHCWPTSPRGLSAARWNGDELTSGARRLFRCRLRSQAGSVGRAADHGRGACSPAPRQARLVDPRVPATHGCDPGDFRAGFKCDLAHAQATLPGGTPRSTGAKRFGCSPRWRWVAGCR